MFSKAPWTTAREAFSGEHHEQPDEKQGEQEESLVTILQTSQDRSDLTLLIADCTETMRQSIIDVFDAKQTGQKSDMTANLTGDDALKNPDIDPAKVDVAAQDRLRKEEEQREKELSGPKMQELKTAALKHFDEWRDNVLQRVGEIVNSREAAKAQKDEAKPQQHAQSPSRKPVTHPKYDDNVGKTLRDLYPPIRTSLTKFDEKKRALVLHSLLLLMLSLEHYSAYSRTLMLHMTMSLGLSIDFLANDESKVARGLLTAAENMKADEETKQKVEANQDNRKWKVGLATVAGAALIGVTGGLAAPLLAAGVGSVMGGLGLGATAAAGYLGTLASSTVLVGGLFGAYGGRMTGKMMDQYAREVEDFAFVPVRTYHKPRKIEKEYRRLRIAVGISGWLTDKDDVVDPWKVIGIEMESFALRWELEALMNLGNSMTTMIKSAAWGYAKSEIIKRTVFASLTAGLWPLGLLKVSRIIDNPFSVAKARADKAGEVLADALINKAQGERPVTLIGYSLGARVIFTCLKSLANRKAFGLVESVVLLGAPCPSSASDWRLIRTVVSGRVVNVYSVADYILGFLYRSSSIQFGIAGLQAIEGVKGVENVDVGDIVSGHTRYRYLTGTIMKRIGFEDVDAAEVKREEEALKEEEAREAEARAKSEQKEGKTEEAAWLDATAGATDIKAPEVSDEQVKELEKEVELKNRESYIGWATEKMKLGGVTAATAYAQAKAQWAMRGTPAGKAASEAGKVTSQAGKATSEVTTAAPDAGKATLQVGTTAPDAGKATSPVGTAAPGVPKAI